MRGWHHGHSLGSGVLVGLLLTRRPELLVAGGVLAGYLVARGQELIRFLRNRRRRVGRGIPF